MGLERYKVKFLKNVNERDLLTLPKTIKSRVMKAIEQRLTVDPINLGEALHHSLKGYKRLRVSDYRVLYHVNILKHEVTIVTIGHRDTIYEKARKILHRH